MLYAVPVWTRGCCTKSQSLGAISIVSNIHKFREKLRRLIERSIRRGRSGGETMKKTPETICCYYIHTSVVNKELILRSFYDKDQ